MWLLIHAGNIDASVDYVIILSYKEQSYIQTTANLLSGRLLYPLNNFILNKQIWGIW